MYGSCANGAASEAAAATESRLDCGGAVKFVIEHTFERLTPAAYESLYFDETFSLALGDHLQLGRELLHLERTAERIVRHVRCEPKRDRDSPGGKALGNSRASYVEEMDYDVAARRGRWRTIPNLFADRVKTGGTLEIVAAPGGAGVTRIVRGEVSVSAFGFGRMIEKAIVAEIEKSYRGAAAFTVDWLRRASRP